MSSGSRGPLGMDPPRSLSPEDWADTVPVSQNLLDNSQRKPGPACAYEEYSVLEYVYRTRDVLDAWESAQKDYVGPAIVDHVGEDFKAAIDGFLPGLLTAFAVVLAGSIIGAVVGAVAGGGAGAVPGAILGAKIAMWVLTFLGLGFLFVHLKDRVGEVGDQMKRGIETAWNACGNEAAKRTAAKAMAEAFGILFSLLLQALIAYVAKVGMAKAVSRLSKTKWGKSLGDFLQNNRSVQEKILIRQWMDKLGYAQKPPLVQQRIGTAIKYMKQHFPDKSDDALLGYMKGIDFSKPLREVDVLPAEILVQFYHPKFGLGNFFTRLKGGAPMDRLGVASGPRTYTLWKPKKNLKALESHAAPMKDTWTVDKKLTRKIQLKDPVTGEPTGGTKEVEIRVGEFVDGGGKQLMLPARIKTKVFDKPTRLSSGKEVSNYVDGAALLEPYLPKIPSK